MFIYPVCTTAGRGDSDRREDSEARGRVCRQPPNHHGHRGWLPGSECTQVRLSYMGLGCKVDSAESVLGLIQGLEMYFVG